MKYDLVIFDCDGVLVDSEPLANRVESELLSRLRRPVSEHEASALFKGKDVGGVVEAIERELGAKVAPDWVYEWAMATALRFVRELRAVPGVVDVLEGLARRGVAMCVASQSTPSRVALSLDQCRLGPYFGDRVYTASMVERPKPAPDLFLYAAGRHAADPSRCCVIEDSVIGVLAARAAQMNVCAYAADEDGERLAAAGGRVFHRMTELAELLK